MLFRQVSDFVLITNSHVLLIAGSGILVVGCDVNLGSLRNGYIFIAFGIPSANFGAFLDRIQTGHSQRAWVISQRGKYRVKRNCKRSTGLRAFCFSRVVDYGLMILGKTVSMPLIAAVSLRRGTS